MNLKLRLKIIEKFQTQSDFAAKIGINESVISRVVRGRRELSAEAKGEWAKALKCKPEEIFS